MILSPISNGKKLIQTENVALIEGSLLGKETLRPPIDVPTAVNFSHKSKEALSDVGPTFKATVEEFSSVFDT